MRTGPEIARALATAIVGALIAAPLAWALWASFMPEARLLGDAAESAATVAHYRALAADGRFLEAIFSSLVVAGLTTAASLALATPAAYALARLEFRYARAVLGTVLVAGVLPQVVLLAPLHALLVATRLMDSWPGLALTHLSFGLPLAVWAVASALQALPPDLEEAAQVDGSTRVGAFFRVTLPLAWPGITAAAVLVFVASWNELLFASSFTVSPAHHTVPVAIALLAGRHQVPWGQMMAAAMLATVPVAVLVLALQRRVVAGLTEGALKG